MTTKLLCLLAIGAISVAALGASAASNRDPQSETPVTSATSAAAAPQQPAATGPKQIIKNEELMKLLFDPYYVDLRKAISEEPEGRAGWRQAYIAIFRLSEVTNLLYSREGKDYMGTDEWNEMATHSRDAAQAVGAAVLKLDYERVRKSYERLIQTCNDCHQKFELEKPTDVKVW